MFVVAGVSGNTGSVVANTLLGEGHHVRVLVRDEARGAPWKAKGAEVAVADLFGAVEPLARAFAGAKGAYVLMPPLLAEDFLARLAGAARTVAAALAAARVEHTVLLSSVGAQHATGTGPIVAVHRAEEELRAAGLDATFLRAAYFMDNLARDVAPARGGVLPALGEPTVAFPMIASDDIGRTAARALLAPRKGQSVLNLSYRQPYSLDDAAAALGRALGRPVKTTRVPDEAIADTLVRFGMPRANGAAIQEMMQSMARGLLVPEAGTETVHGSVSLDAFAERIVRGAR